LLSYNKICITSTTVDDNSEQIYTAESPFRSKREYRLTFGRAKRPNAINDASIMRFTEIVGYYTKMMKSSQSV